MAKQRPFRISDVNTVREIGSMDATRDGTLVAFTTSELSTDGGKIVSRIWLVDEDAAEGARPITAKDRRAGAPKFCPDGTRLAYLAERDEKMQLVVLTMPFSEPEPLTTFDAGVRAFDWLTNSRLVVLAEPDKPERKKKAKEDKDDAYEVDVDEPQARMFLVSLRGGKPRPIGPRRGHVAVASASPDGKTIAYIHCRHSTLTEIWKGSSLWLLNVRTGRSRHVRTMSAPTSAMWAPQFSPDGSRLAVIDGIRKGMIYPQRVYIVSLDGGRARMVDRDADRIASQPRWLDDDTVAFLQQDSVHRKLRAAPASGKPGRDLVGAPGSVADFITLPEAERVYFVHSTCDAPKELHRLDLGTAAVKLTAVNRKLASIRHARAEVIRWQSKEGWTVEGLFMRPTKNVRAPWATVLMPHGGPHGAISDEYTRVNAHLLCARGYAVFLPNFRGSTGYGTKFMLSIRQNWGGAPADDIIRGIEYLVRRRLVDRRRIVVNGGSYGGYMTAWLIGHYRGTFRAAIAHAPVVNNISMWGTTDIPSFKEWSYGGRPLTTFKRYWQQSPVSALKGCKTPTMVVTGDVDLRVPVGQSQELYRFLKAEGAPTRLVRYPREPHGFGEPRHKTDFLKRQLAWFREHLGKDSPDR